MIKISLAIPTYNSSSYLRRNLDRVINDPRISEVIINDDASKDFQQLKESVAGLDKVNIQTNEINLGAFENKQKTASRCSNLWAVLLDADNIISTQYLDKLYEQYWGNGDIIYCPAFAKPAFNFSFCAGVLMDKQYVAKNMADRMLPLLNDGNYLIPTREFVKCGDKFKGCKLICDVIFFALGWLRDNNKLKVVPGLEYEHTMRSDSLWMQHQEQGMDEVQRIRAALVSDYALNIKGDRDGH